MEPKSSALRTKKKWLIIGGLVVALILVLLSVSSKRVSTSSIEITVTGGSKGDYTYTVLNQADDSQTVSHSSSITFTKNVPAGSYEVLVTQGETSYFSLVKTNPLSKTTVSAKLSPERARTFVGNNPQACLNLLGTTLFSHICGTTSGDTTLYVPATASSPTYADTPMLPLGHLESNIKTAEGNLAMFSAVRQDEEYTGQTHVRHTVYIYHPSGSTITPTDKATLTNLDQTKAYTLANYQNGFIAYDGSFSDIWYFPSIHAAPTKINVAAAKTKGLEPVSLAASPDGSIAVAYAPIISTGDAGGKQPKNLSSTSEIVLDKDGKSRHFVYQQQFTSLSFCGRTQLCLLDHQKSLLSVRNTSSSQLSQLFALHGVSNVSGYNQSIIAVRSNGVLRLDPDNLTGSLDYTFGDYQYNSFQNTDTGYVLSVTSANGDHSALYVDHSTPNTFSIDKKVAQLRAADGVATISAYSTFLYVVPRGPIVGDPVTHKYGPDPKIQPGINASIVKAAAALGFDPKAYTITITSP